MFGGEAGEGDFVGVDGYGDGEGGHDGPGDDLAVECDGGDAYAWQ